MLGEQYKVVFLACQGRFGRFWLKINNYACFSVISGIFVMIYGRVSRGYFDVIYFHLLWRGGVRPDRSRRQAAILLWSPERSSGGTFQVVPFFGENTSGLEYCGYSVKPSSVWDSAASDSWSPRTLGMWRETASTTVMAGSSPPVTTYGPTESSSSARYLATRSSTPS